MPPLVCRERDGGSSSVVGVGIRLIPGWASAVLGRVSLSDASRVDQIGWNNIPYVIRRDKGKGTGYVVLGTEVAGVDFNLL